MPQLRSLVALLLVMAAFEPAAASAPGAGSDVGFLFGSINAERAAQRLQPLALDARLCRVAYEHAVDMLRRSYFSHTTPERDGPLDRMRAAHVRVAYLGENLGLARDARLVSRDLWLSLEHRSNVLGRHFRRVGIAAVHGALGTIVVEDFAD